MMIFNVVLLQGEAKRTSPCVYILTDDVSVYFMKSFKCGMLWRLCCNIIYGIYIRNWKKCDVYISGLNIFRWWSFLWCTVWFTWMLLSIGWHGFLLYEKLVWCLLYYIVYPFMVMFCGFVHTKFGLFLEKPWFMTLKSLRRPTAQTQHEGVSVHYELPAIFIL